METEKAQEIRRMFLEAIDRASENSNKKTATEGGVKYSSKEDSDSIKEQIKSNLDKLNKMNVVATIYEKVKFTDSKSLLNWVMDRLKNTGYKISRQNYGDIVLDEKRIKNGISYLKTDAEKIAFAAVTSIIKKGIEIGRHSNHKGRQYNTVTFAAPVEINGYRGNMAVTVREESKNYYKVHRILTPDGSVFEIQNKKGTVETAGGAEKNSSGLSPTDSTFIDNISDNFENVNTKNEKFSLKGEKWDSSTENNSDSIDNSSKKRNNKRSYYNEQESLFMMWSNSHNTEIGSTKAFTRFGKQHFYKKTESGVIEISKTQFYEKGDKIYEENYGRTRRSVYANSDRNGNEQRGHDSSDSVYGHAGEDERNTLYIRKERLQNDLAGNLQRRRTDSGEVRLNEDDKRSIKDVEDIDIKYSRKYNKGDNAFSKALTAEEWIKYNSAITTGVDAGLRINDHSLLVECEKGDYSYKLVIYDNTFEEKPINVVYGIGNDSYTDTMIHEVAKTITGWEDEGYGRSFIYKRLKNYAKMYGIVLGRYSGQSGRFTNFRRSNNASGRNTQKQSNRGTVSSGTQKIGKQSLKDNTDIETSSIIDTSSTRYILSEALKDATLILKHLYSSIRCF